MRQDTSPPRTVLLKAPGVASASREEPQEQIRGQRRGKHDRYSRLPSKNRAMRQSNGHMPSTVGLHQMDQVTARVINDNAGDRP
jgi:hypothetical protein